MKIGDTVKTKGKTVLWDGMELPAGTVGTIAGLGKHAMVNFWPPFDFEPIPFGNLKVLEA